MLPLVAKTWPLCVVLTLVLACASVPAPTTKSKEAHARVLSTRTISSDVVPVAAKTIAQRSGTSTAALLPDIQGTVVGVQLVKSTSYLRVRCLSIEPLLGPGSALAQVECEPSIRCQVAEASEAERLPGARQPKPAAVGKTRRQAGKSRGASLGREPELLIRLTDPTTLAQLQSVTLRSLRSHAGGTQRKIRISGFDSAPKDANLEREFALSWAEFIRAFAGEEPFAAFAAARMERLPLAGNRLMGVSDARQIQRTELRELMEFYTGQAEVRQTLQTDRGLGISARVLPKTLALASLHGVEHEPRDYRTLLAGEAGIQPFVPHPLAGSVPADALVLEFASIRDLSSLPQRIDQRLGQILAALEGHPGDNRLLERYRSQLILEQTSLAEKLGHMAIGAASLVIGDPYLREGSDVSLVFEVRDRKLLETALASFVANARSAHPDLEAKNLVLADTPVVLHKTLDGRLQRYQAWVGPALLLSNSQQALLHMLELQRKPASSLVQAPDYVWARSVAPFAVEAERALLFFGDAFVDKITGPRSKILEARRMRALADLRSVEYAALLFGWMQGAPPKSLDELLASGWLTKSDLVHFDGSPIAFEPQTGASSRFGTPDQLLPIVDLEIGKIDKDEADAYAQFRVAYERGLRGALDPTTLRFLRTASEDQWRTELRILPLTPSGEIGSQFREIVRSVGRGTIQTEKNPEGVRVALGISRESPLRGLADGAVHGVLARRDLTLGFLGDWAEVGVADDPWLWNFAVADHALPELDGPREEYAEFDIEHNLHRIPLWAAVHIKSPVLLAATLTALRAQSHERLGDWITWKDSGTYRGLSVTRVDIRPSGGMVSPASIHFAVANDVLVLSLERRILELRVNEVLAGLRPKAADAASGASQLMLTFERGATHHLTDTLAALLDASGLSAHRRACLGLSLLAAGYGEAAANGSARASLGLRLFGYSPESPAGPGLVIKNGQCQHPIYGTSFAPAIPDGRDATSPLHAAVRHLSSMRFGLAVIPRADEQELVGRAEIEWK